MLFDPAKGPDFETAKKNIMIGKVVYTILGVGALYLSAKNFYNLGGVVMGERIVNAFERAFKEDDEN